MNEHSFILHELPHFGKRGHDVGTGKMRGDRVHDRSSLPLMIDGYRPRIQFTVPDPAPVNADGPRFPDTFGGFVNRPCGCPKFSLKGVVIAAWYSMLKFFSNSSQESMNRW